ncbi:MAG: Sua5/YciO/YrdC/YwlC family protein, partial [Burkholderiales bacterium]
MKAYTAIKFTLQGIVQGVGFRPAIYKLCRKLNYAGWVKNTAAGVEVVIANIEPEEFLTQLHSHLPPLAKIDQITKEKINLSCLPTSFKILTSQAGPVNTKLSADIAICSACVQELFNPSSRYYLYPFIACANCGPRYSTTIALPYDRHHTALNKFPLCYGCKLAYTNPLDRRYYTQGISCPSCGPQLSMKMIAITEAIKAGQIVALKGTAGYHLIVDAKNLAALARLRQRKHRPAKPFALMALNLSCIAQYVELTEATMAALTSTVAPIVLLKMLNHTLPEILAPGLNHLGFMLPNSGLDYLLFYFLLGQPQGEGWLSSCNEVVLVVTSANFAGGAIVSDDQKARVELAELADLIVSYNKDIVTRCDDSVLKPTKVNLNIFRLGRGYAPRVIKLAAPVPEVLALGTSLKNTICLTKHDQAYISQYIGDMTNFHSYEYFFELIG